MGEKRCIDDGRHDENDAAPDPQESRICPEIAEDAEAARPHVKPVHQRGQYEQQEIRRVLLRLPRKARGKNRLREEDKAEQHEPCPHPENLRRHRRADDARIAATRLLVHIALMGGLVAEHDSAEAVHDKVDEEQMRHAQRFHDAEKWRKCTDDNGGDIDDKLKTAKLQDVVVDRASIEDRILDRAEIIVEDDDVARIPCCLRAAPHRKADIGAPQGGRVIDPVPRHADDEIHLLCEAHDARLVRRQGACDYAQLRQDALHGSIVHLCEVTARQNELPVRTQESRITSDCDRRLTAVACHHDNLDTRCLHLGDRRTRLRAHIVANRRKADEHRVRIHLIRAECRGRIPERKDAHGACRVCVDRLRQGVSIVGYDISRCIECILRAGEEHLGRPLIDDDAACGQLCLTEFVHRVKRLPLPCPGYFIRL